MAISSIVGRIRACISRMSYFHTVLILTVIGLTAIVIGFIGMGLYVATARNYNAYVKTVCLILDHQYDNCQHGYYLSSAICYTVTWSVEYPISDSPADRHMFSTITETYDKSTDALGQLAGHTDQTNQTCYYHNVNSTNVQWTLPQRPTPFLIMIVVGFSFAVVYFVVIATVAICRCRKRRESSSEKSLESS